MVTIAGPVVVVLGALAAVSGAPGFVIAAVLVAALAVRAWRVRLEVKRDRMVVANVFWTRRVRAADIVDLRWHAVRERPWMAPGQGMVHGAGSTDTLVVVMRGGIRPLQATVLRTGNRRTRHDAAIMVAAWLGQRPPVLTYDDQWLGPDLVEAAEERSGPVPPDAA